LKLPSESFYLTDKGINRLKEYGTIIVLLLPLFFINIKSTHDWGDDFAQYLQQAKNITEEKSLNETGYIFNEDFFIGPKAYPAGFPLLLAPLVNNVGFDIKILNLYMSLFWFLSCMMGFLILRKHVSFLSAICITLIIGYNPQMINFKTEVLSDYPYTFFSLLCLYLMYFRTSITTVLITGILLGLLAHIRSIGMVIWIVFILLFLEQFYSKALSPKQTIRLISNGTIAMLLVYFGIRISFPANTNYPGLFETENLWNNWHKQLSYNADKLFMFFRWFNMDNYFYIGVISASSFIAFSILGYINALRKHFLKPLTLYFTLYLLVIISFKLGDTGLRFMFPLLFLFFVFTASGLKKTLLAFDINLNLAKWVITTLVLFSYYFEIRTIIEKTDTAYEGPNKQEAQETYEFINTNLKPESVIHFDKPRALALYTNCKSFATNPYTENYHLINNLKKFNADYLLTSSVISDSKIHQTANSLPEQFKMIFKNEEFCLFELNLN
jgi:hypothetical protein